MKYEKDTFGQEILAHFKGKNSFEVVERNDGYVSVAGGAKSYFAEYGDWPRQQKLGIKFAKGRVLDIGCGAGRVSLYLQGRGLDATGIDNSPLAIMVCRKRGLKKAKLMPIEKIGKFKPNSFDSIVMFGNNFGLFGSFKKARRLLKVMRGITSQKAVIIAESREIYKTTEPAHWAYYSFNRKRGRMPGQLRIRIRFGPHTSKWFDYLLASKKEMERILRGTGWKVRKFIGSNNSTYVAVIDKA